jgi:hypothetical protein
MSEVIEVNPDGIQSGMWNATWEVGFGHTLYYGHFYHAAADCESDALDEVIDYLEREDEETLGELVIDPDTYVDMSEEKASNIVYAGNRGYPLQLDLEISIRLVKRHRRY